MIPTRSPTRTPAAMSPLATASTSSANWAQVRWVHPPDGVLRENAVSFADSLALRSGRSARLPSVVTGASGATTVSFTVTPGEGAGQGCTLPSDDRGDHVTRVSGPSPVFAARPRWVWARAVPSWH